MSCLCIWLIIFLSLYLCRSWECQVGTSRRTGSQHQHNPPRVEPLQSLPLWPPVSHPVSVLTHHQRWAAGKFYVLRCWFSFLKGKMTHGLIFRRHSNGRCPQLTCCFALAKYRSWLQLSSTPFLTTPELSSPNPSTDMGGNEGKGGERWNFFGTRSLVHKSPTDPGSESGTGGGTYFTLIMLILFKKKKKLEKSMSIKVDWMTWIILSPATLLGLTFNS